MKIGELAKKKIIVCFVIIFILIGLIIIVEAYSRKELGNLAEKSIMLVIVLWFAIGGFLGLKDKKVYVLKSGGFKLGSDNPKYYSIWRFYNVLIFIIGCLSLPWAVYEFIKEILFIFK